MMRAVAQVAQRQRELPQVTAAVVRGYFAPQSVAFTEDVALAKPAAKDAPSILDDWKSKKAGTEELLKLLNTYKDLGDAKNEPYLKFHNPRTFEDMTKAVPNFRSMNLKAGEVPRFFDNVLQGRASDAVDQKNAWWAARKKDALDSMKSKTFSAFPTVPVPAWSYGKSVSIDSLKQVTDSYVKSLEPKRKLQLSAVPEDVKESINKYAKSLKQDKTAGELLVMLAKAVAENAVVVEGGKVVEGFKYVSKAVAAKVIAARRAEVHDRYVKHWAKKVMVSPELAAVPLKDVEAQLASKFEGVAPQYAEVLAAAGAGSKTQAERVAAAPAFANFFLKRETAETVKEDLPVSEEEAQGAALAAKFEDPEAALKALLGPELTPLGAGSGPLSAQVRAVTEHRYTPDRYMYREGMALAARLEKEEKAAEAAGHNSASPATPIQLVLDHMREIESRSAEFEAAKRAADSPYAEYAVAKKQEFTKDASNLAIDELLAPEVVSEMMDIELAELAELEASINDAEEEELWSLTLAAQLKHLQKHFGVDLPHGVIAHMDPLTIKKIDWETTNNLEDFDITLDDMGAEAAKEQWALETLSHHFLPLIRYRRSKARAAGVPFDPELAGPVR